VECPNDRPIKAWELKRHVGHTISLATKAQGGVRFGAKDQRTPGHLKIFGRGIIGSMPVELH